MEGNGEGKTVPEFMTVLEVAELLKVSDRTVYDLCRQGLLPGAAKIGKQWRDDLLAWQGRGDGEYGQGTGQGRVTTWLNSKTCRPEPE